ncbi:sperm-specific sodium:proton exchanger-like isoform X2 [Ornithodoros turicata]|uniref:sperm-specific sodium:proton exchanger-like isoform X2 n=1 Tax=Ornithodoros turicata TaxID=34597 RepID=UPI003139117F
MAAAAQDAEALSSTSSPEEANASVDSLAIQGMIAFSLIAFSEGKTNVSHSLVVLTVATLGSYVMSRNKESPSFADMELGFSQGDVLVMFLPALVFHTSDGINFYLLRKCLSEILLFSVGTTAINTYLCAEYSMAMLETDEGRRWSFILGALQASSDRVTFSQRLLSPHKHPMLLTILNTETLVSTVLSWDIINFAYTRIQQNPNTSMLPLVLELVYSMTLSGITGLVIGAVVMSLLNRAEYRTTFIVIVLMGSVYATFLVLQIEDGCGILGVIAFSTVSNSHTLVTSTEIESVLRSYWEVLHDIGKVLTLVQASVYIGVQLSRNVIWKDMTSFFITYIVCFGIRAIAVVCMLPFLTSVHYSGRWKQAFVLIWLGMRGSLRICLAVLYFTEFKMPAGDATRGVVHLIGVAFLVQVINLSFLESVLKALRLTDDSYMEQTTYSNALRYIRHATRVATVAQKSEAALERVDWTWVANRTRIEALDGTEDNLRKRTMNMLGLTKADRGVPQGESSMKTFEFAIENAIRIQRVSYQRQYVEGMIQKKTEVLLIAALQYPRATKTYLNVDMIRDLIAVPPWVLWVKTLLSSIRPTHQFDDTLDEETEDEECDFDRTFREEALDYFEHRYYELIVASTTASFVLWLWGCFESASRSPLWATLGVVLEGVYMTGFFTEIGLKIYVYGNRIIGTEYSNQLDLLLLCCCSILFPTQCAFAYMGLPEQRRLANIFLVLISTRLILLIDYIEDLWDLLLSAMHRYMDSIIYTAYETGLAVIKGEEEVRENIWKTLDDTLADRIRVHAGENRLEVLRQVVEVHARFPGVAVAFKSRRACQSILNEVQKDLVRIYKDGDIDYTEFKKMMKAIHVSMREIVNAPCSFRSSYKPISVLRSVPWMGSDQLRQFLAIMIRPVSYEPGDVIIRLDDENPLIVTHSGIVKGFGEVGENVDGALPNTASFLYFYSDGYFEDYIVAPDVIGVLTVVSDKPCVTTVIAETAVNAYQIPKQRLLEAIDVFTEWPSFRYQLWRHICDTLSTPLLQSQPQYQTWPTEKVKHRLENMLMPNLMNAKSFHVSPDIEDLLLIQGRIMDAMTEEEYFAPLYVPKEVTRILFPGEVYSRPCPVMVIVANKHYRLPSSIDWEKAERKVKGQDLSDYSFFNRYMFSNM